MFMKNKFGPCAVMAQVTRMAKEDVIGWCVIDGEYAADGVRLWREGDPSEHFDIFPDYEALADIEEGGLFRPADSFFIVSSVDDSSGFVFDYYFRGASPREVAEEVFAAMQAELGVC